MLSQSLLSVPYWWCWLHLFAGHPGFPTINMLFSLNNLWVTVGREFWWHKHLCISRLSFFQGLLSVSVITAMVGKWWPPHPATRFIKSFTFPSWHCAVMRSASFSLSVDDLFVIGNTMDSDFPSTQYTIHVHVHVVLGIWHSNHRIPEVLGQLVMVSEVQRLLPEVL